MFPLFLNFFFKGDVVDFSSRVSERIILIEIYQTKMDLKEILKRTSLFNLTLFHHPLSPLLFFFFLFVIHSI